MKLKFAGIFLAAGIVFWPSGIFCFDNEDCLRQADAYLAQSSLDEAIVEYKRVIQADVINARAYTGLGVAYSEKGDFAKPIAYYQGIFDANPEDVHKCYELGVAHESNGQIDKAKELFEMALRINPEYASAHHSLGDIYGARGDYIKEMEHLKKAVELNTDDIDAYYISNIPYGRKIVYDQARDCFLTAIKIDSDYSDAYLGLGRLYTKLAKLYAYEINFDSAIRYLQKVVALKHSSPDIYYLMGNTLWERGRSDEAINMFRKAIEGGIVSSSDSYYSLGLIYSEMNKSDKAAECFKEAILLDAHNAMAYYYLGLYYVSKGNKIGASQQARALFGLNRKDLAGQLE